MSIVGTLHASMSNDKPASELARTSISLPKSLYEKALQRAKELHFANFSDYVQHLLRDELVFREKENPVTPKLVSKHPLLDPNAPPPPVDAPPSKRRRLRKGERGLEPLEEN